MIEKANCWSTSQKTESKHGRTNNDHDGTRTHNLPIRSRTPYPLGHAAVKYILTKTYLKFFMFIKILYQHQLTELQT